MLLSIAKCVILQFKGDIMNRLILFLLLCFSVVGCNTTDSFCEKIMQKADSIMERNSDSVSASIRLLDSILPKVPSLSVKQGMRYHLLYAKAMNKGYVVFSSDSIMRQVCEYYDNHGASKEKMLAYYLLGCVYRDINDSPKAISCLNKALEFSDNDVSSHQLSSKICGQKAEIFYHQALVEQECQELDRAAYYAMLAHDSLSAIIDISLKAHAYSLVNKHDSAVYYNDIAVNRFKELGYEEYAAKASLNSIISYVELGKYPQAKKCIDIYEQKSGHYKNDTVIAGYESYYYIKGMYYTRINKLDSARLLFKRCQTATDNPKMRLNAYRGFSLMFNKMGIADSAAKYAMLTYELNDSIYQKESVEALLRLQASYNYERLQEEAKKKSDDIIELQWWLTGTVFIIIFVAGVFVYAYKRIRKANQWKLLQATERYKTEKSILQMEMEEMNALLAEQVSLLEHKDLIIERKSRELNNEIERKECSIKELQDRVAQYEQKLNFMDTAAIEDKIQSSSIKGKFMYFATHVTEHPTDGLWKELIRFAKTQLPQMYILLNKYNVSNKDLRICILIRLKFKPGEIATIMDCRFPEVSLTRSRLLQKIYGIDGRASDFDRRLMLLY